MAFDNVTLFEVHLDDATISPALGADAATEKARTGDGMTMDETRTDAAMRMDAETDAEQVAEASSGRRGRGRVVAVVALVVVAGVAAALRRRRGGVAEVDEDDEGIAIETVDDAESVAAVDR